MPTASSRRLPGSPYLGWPFLYYSDALLDQSEAVAVAQAHLDHGKGKGPLCYGRHCCPHASDRRDLESALLDEEIAERDAAQALLAIADRVEDSGRRLLGRQDRALLGQQRLDRGGISRVSATSTKISGSSISDGARRYPTARCDWAR